MGLEPRRQALANRLRAIQPLDPRYHLLSIGAMAVTVVGARQQMPLVTPPPYAMLDPTLRPEYVRQLRDQQDGINAMTCEQWLQNRGTFDISGRSRVGTNMQRLYQRRMLNPAGTAAPHNPDQGQAGYADPTGVPASAVVNSHIGSQNPPRTAYTRPLVQAIDPAARLVTQMNVRLEVV
jgi:hypothetical protein